MQAITRRNWATYSLSPTVIASSEGYSYLANIAYLPSCATVQQVKATYNFSEIRSTQGET